MRILILGGDGMLGHQLFNYLSPRHELRVTLRGALSAYSRYNLFTADNAYCEVDARNRDRITEVVADFHPQWVINAVGIIKQRPDAQEPIAAIEINALLPHRLALICKAAGARLLHFSTDCVFSGRRGNYSESDYADAEDLYGRTKFLGEVQESHCITLRTSIIGRELARHRGLLAWLLAQRGTVPGFTRAIFTGFTTIEIGRIVERLISAGDAAQGLYHVSSEAISKYDLLSMIKAELALPLELARDENVGCDRSLDSSRFRTRFDYCPPSWRQMIKELAEQIREGKDDIFT